MPKTKAADKKIEKVEKKPADELEKIIDIDDTAVAEVPVEDELIPGEVEDEDLEDDDAGLDEEEVDPFKDKWEE